MFEKLRSKWKVNGFQLFLVLLTFALGGSLCGYISKKIISFLPIDRGIAWFLIYIIILTITWPFCVMVISLITGQYHFFRNYLAKLALRMSGRKKPSVRIAIFASGAGSNARKILEYFKDNPRIEVALIVTNRPNAGVVKIAEESRLPVLFLERSKFFSEDAYIGELKKHRISWIILAGFLWKVPPTLVSAYRDHIINIHPALLPEYGGKGMYGHHVHEAVIGNKEKYSGISIHMVDEIYDHGRILYQAKCGISESDTPETLAARIHDLEHKYFSSVIEATINGKPVTDL